jgi:ubiquinone biosynthesis protein Coq4
MKTQLASVPPEAAPKRLVEDVADLSTPVRWRRAAIALTRVLKNPEETDQVLVFSNLINAGKRDSRLNFFYDDPRGKKLFDEKRTIDSSNVDLHAFAALPSGTLGHAYATFMLNHGLTPNVFDGPPEDVRDPRAAFVIQRMRQTHDLWHVVTNCETDPSGEIALQAFTFAQVKAPSSAILAIMGTLRSTRYTRKVWRDALDLYWRGRQAQPLVLFPWEDHWTTPLADVRRMLGLPANPEPTGGYLTEQFVLSKMAA